LATAVTHLRRLSLTAYRNYLDLRVELTAAPVVLWGANGSGKTNILEAISLLAPGRGLRRAVLADLQSHATTSPWAVAAELTTPAGFTTLSTGLDPADPARDRRVVRIDGKPAKGQSALSENLALVWLTPDMDRVLVEGPGTRRKFLDRLVFGFDPAHAGRVNRYEQSLRERMRLLRDGMMDAAWLNALEDDLARTGTAIAAARKQMTEQLNAIVNDGDAAFPHAHLALAGLAEDLLATQAALTVEDTLRARLAAGREDDRRNDSCATGPHRSDVIVTHTGKNLPADLCSTGEQKSLLIRIVLAHARLLARWRGSPPVLLLDDIASHLDEIRRAALYENLLASGSQFWLSGTDHALFDPLLAKAQFFVVRDGAVTPGGG
jgi:DNA replication and repair protein RecF